MTRTASPSLLRWILVGVPCYASWLVVNLALLALFPLYIAVELIGGAPGRRLLRRIGVGFLRVFFLYHLPLVGVYRVEKTADLDRLKALPPCLVVANHTSWLDALILFCLIPDVRILISARYQNVPLVRYPMRWLECIFVDRRSRESVVESIRRIGGALEGGAPVAVFPEGTRGPVGQLKPFKDLFFRIAVDVGSAVQPVLLCLDRPFLGPGAENFLTAGKATLRIRVPDRLIPDPKEGGKDLAFRTRGVMKRAMRAAVAEARGSDTKNGGSDE